MHNHRLCCVKFMADVMERQNRACALRCAISLGRNVTADYRVPNSISRARR
jgi:hypothetical protein